MRVNSHSHLSAVDGRNELGRKALRLGFAAPEVRLRLSRWGEAVHIDEDPQLGNPAATRVEIQAAKDTLLQILVLMEDSNKISKTFRIKGDSATPAPEDLAADPAIEALTSWAIHHGAAAKTLIEDISGLVNNLGILFPAPNAEKQLAKEEVATVKERTEIQALESASRGLDSTLHEALSEVSGHKFDNIDIEGGKDAMVVNGNVISADYTGVFGLGVLHSFENIKIKGADGLRVLNGDKYGGVDLFAMK
ncbi:hypothetical protein B7463_g5551, partial [Scytalidium lignicola]